MAKPPAGSSLLFGALADSGRIKQRKNGSYRMVLKGIDDIDWFTDRPDRDAGEWSPKKLVKKWDSLFGDVEPNAQATFEVSSKRKLVTFEMFKPKLSDSNQTLSFKVRGISEKNKDLLTGLRNKRLSDASLFIDDGTTGDRVVYLEVTGNGLRPTFELFSNSPNAVFGKPINIRYVFDHPIVYDAVPASLENNGKIIFVGGDEGWPVRFKVPVTLKNGITSSSITFKRAEGCGFYSGNDFLNPGFITYLYSGWGDGGGFLWTDSANDCTASATIDWSS